MPSATSDSALLVDAREGVVTLTLNRPDKLNAISLDVVVLLREQLDHLATDPDVACLVLTGAGRSFSAGLDLATLPDDPEKFGFIAETFDVLEAFPRPTIAKLHGHCFTGALELALTCDILVAADDAMFADTHSHWGIVPVAGMSVRLPERVGAARAKLLGFSGRRIDAATALAWGLVDLQPVRDELDAAVDALTAQICANSADANRILKELIRRGQSSDLARDEKLRMERSLVSGVPADRLERLSAVGRS
jgi:enoyl-CoA hydratase